MNDRLSAILTWDKAQNYQPPEKRRPKRHTHTLYVISDGTLSKVGITGDVPYRLNQLRLQGCRPNLTICYERHIGERAALVEKACHRALKEHHVLGEWFRLPPDAVILAVQKVLSEL